MTVSKDTTAVPPPPSALQLPSTVLTGSELDSETILPILSVASPTGGFQGRSTWTEIRPMSRMEMSVRRVATVASQRLR